MKKTTFLTIFALLMCLGVSTIASALATVDLGTASNFAILSKSGITNVPTSDITGNVGTSPITGASIGLTCSEVTGTIYDADGAYTNPVCLITDSSLLTTAVGDMQTAYNDAMGRTNPNSTELGSGHIGGMTLEAGLYKWTTAVDITTDLYLNGSSSDVWIFQIDGTLDISSATDIILLGDAQASNIFWAVAGETNLGTTSNFKGTILCANSLGLHLLTGANLEGRALSTFDVTLQSNTITLPVGTPAITSLVQTANPNPVNYGSTSAWTARPVHSSDLTSNVTMVISGTCVDITLTYDWFDVASGETITMSLPTNHENSTCNIHTSATFSDLSTVNATDIDFEVTEATFYNEADLTPALFDTGVKLFIGFGAFAFIVGMVFAGALVFVIGKKVLKK